MSVGAAGAHPKALRLAERLAVLGVLARFSLLGHFPGRHVDEEARGFAADITRKHGEGDRQRAQGGRR
jgi:hypothetical protein